VRLAPLALMRQVLRNPAGSPEACWPGIAQAHAAGRLLGRVGSRDVVDAAVADTTAHLRADVVTGDRTDIRRLLDAAGQIIDV